MDIQQQYENNLEKYSIQHPKSGFIIGQAENPHLSICHSEPDKDLNLCCQHPDGTTAYYHNASSPTQEAALLFSSVNLEGIDVLHVFGIGMGHFYKAAQTWLHADAKRQLVFFEHDPAVLQNFFYSELANVMLDDVQVEIVLFRDLHDEDIFEDICWNFILSELQFCCLPYYESKYFSLYEELQQKIAYESSVKNALVDEYLKYGAGFFKNFYPNLMEIPHSRLGTELFDKFHNIPAIICGAGPSLNKHLDLLKQLGDKAVIFAPGSAMNALTANHIIPHFGAGIDPNPMQYERLKQNKGFEVPFFYRNRMLYQAFMEIHGPKLYIPGAGGYDAADWFDEQLRLECEWLDEGHNVVNFCMEIATRMGCNPIIAVGLDLAYTDMQAYASGVNDRIDVTKNELLAGKGFEDRAFIKTDIFGKPVYTLWKWVAESDWIAEFIREHPETLYINATEGGIGVQGMENKTLASVIKEQCNNSFPLYDKIHQEIQNSSLKDINEGKIYELIETFRQSLLRSIEHLDVLIDDAKRQKEIAAAVTPLPSILQSGFAALSESELADEIAYKYLLEIFNAVYTRVLTREAHQKKMIGRTDAEKTISIIEINSKRLRFMKDVCLANLALIDLAYKMYNKEAGNGRTSG